MVNINDEKQILIVDDETRIRDLLRIVLESRGYDVLEARNGEEALYQMQTASPDMVILDVMMPIMNGFECCKKIRQTSNCPIIMLTAKGEDYDQVQGLECGADDYVVKPFTPMVLTARVHALFRRSKKQDENKNEYGNIRIDTDAREVWANDQIILLNRKEYDLLLYLVENENISLNRDQMLECVWGYDYLGSSNTVDTHINRLRNKLGDCGAYIVTLRGYGYRFEVKS